MGAFRQAPHEMQEDGVDAHRHSTCISEPALLSNAQVKKRVSSLLRSDAFFLACPFRLEAVTKILIARGLSFPLCFNLG